MKHAISGFDRIARIYDFLARLVFGDNIVKAQACFLSEIPNQSNVLIVGGGTGNILVELFKRKPQCNIWYIDASKEMIDLARGKVQANSKVTFIHGTQDDIPVDTIFHIVITNFYLDLFSKNKLEDVIKKIGAALSSNGKWLVADFIPPKRPYQQLLLFIMYRFFRIVCRIEASVLPPWKEHIERTGIQLIDQRLFCNGFVESVIYQKMKTRLS